MANQSSYSSKSFHIVIEEFDRVNDKHVLESDIDNYCSKELRFNFYAFIIHDSDVGESGEKERKHYHLVVLCNQSYSKNTIINSIASGLFINKDIVSVRRTISFIKSVRYLVHKDNVDKFPYQIQDIWTNDLNEVTLCIYENSSSYDDLDIDYLCLLVEKSKSLCEVYKTLGLKKSKLYRSIISDLWKEEHPYGY